jgi:hypothetical protein
LPDRREVIAPEIVAAIARSGQYSQAELEQVAFRIRHDLETALGLGRFPAALMAEQIATKAVRVARAALEGAP